MWVRTCIWGEWLTLANTLAYHGTELITTVKSFCDTSPRCQDRNFRTSVSTIFARIQNSFPNCFFPLLFFLSCNQETLAERKAPSDHLLMTCMLVLYSLVTLSFIRLKALALLFWWRHSCLSKPKLSSLGLFITFVNNFQFNLVLI